MQNKTIMQEYVINILKNKLPANYYYHNYEHTLYVQEKAIEIGMHEGCTKKEIELLSAAALWHDAGYINTYYGHEEASCLLAKKHLPQFGFSDKDIAKIIGMIMATKILQTPKNKLEEILADADLEYLGTTDVAEKAHLLFKEMQSLSPTLNEAVWNKMQIAFLETHHYFTQYCKANKDPIRHAYHKKLIDAEKEICG
jgi:predicted metal-dependent HD superfamily phosphohydrolase